MGAGATPNPVAKRMGGLRHYPRSGRSGENILILDKDQLLSPRLQSAEDDEGRVRIYPAIKRGRSS